MRIIDAHQHCWQLGKHGCQWPSSDLTAIYRDYSPVDFLAEVDGLGVAGSVLVQSQPDIRDTHYLLQLAADYPHIRGVVGWVDLSAPQATEQIAELASNPRLCGLRPMLQGLAMDDWIITRARTDALGAMAEHNLVFDALVDSRHLPFIGQLAASFPALSIVLDHAAKPAIATLEGESWRQGIDALAAYPNVYCKLSGLPTEMAAQQSWEAMQPYMRQVLELFGAERLLWGSDWPVINLAGDYSRWLCYCWQWVEQQGPAYSQAIFAETAQKLYRLDEN
ncbi:MAG TPA: amidohydrolase family protein [Cellvibrionaceae bacterium]